MPEQYLIEATQIYSQVCNMINRKDNKVQYEVLQLSSLFKEPDFAYQIANLYNGYRKNIDFIHLPNIKTILENSRKFPIIIARRRDTKNLIGISTIKYFENNESYTNPYFPEKDAHYFEISGLLVREDNITLGFPGVGQKINEIAVVGASLFHQNHQDVRMIGVIDIRNVPSISAMQKSLNSIKNQRYFGDLALPCYIIGYYELHDFNTDALTEAQTLVLEVGLTPGNIESIVSLTMDLKSENESVTEVIDRELQRTLSCFGITRGETMQDPGCGNVIFYSINNKELCRIENLTVFPHQSALGNDRIVSEEELVHTESSYARKRRNNYV